MSRSTFNKRGSSTTGRTRLSFGKYAGTCLRDLPITYLRWLETITIYDPKLTSAIKRELDRREV